MTHAVATASAEAVFASLELLGARGEDRTAAVYDQLLAFHRDYRTWFARDTDDPVKHAMLLQTISAMLDYLADPGAGG